jgi:hypothetical protein
MMAYILGLLSLVILVKFFVSLDRTRVAIPVASKYDKVLEAKQYHPFDFELAGYAPTPVLEEVVPAVDPSVHAKCYTREDAMRDRGIS